MREARSGRGGFNEEAVWENGGMGGGVPLPSPPYLLVIWKCNCRSINSSNNNNDIAEAFVAQHVNRTSKPLCMCVGGCVYVYVCMCVYYLPTFNHLPNR